jgi:hypothetical protein
VSVYSFLEQIQNPNLSQKKSNTHTRHKPITPPITDKIIASNKIEIMNLFLALKDFEFLLS